MHKHKQWHANHAAPCIDVIATCAPSQGAIKLVNAALSKYRGDQLLRALKAHALDRGGRTQEALVVSLPLLSTAGLNSDISAQHSVE